MGNIMYGATDCPQCDYQASYSYNCMTREETVECPYCGYRKEKALVDDAMTVSELKGHGTVHVRQDDGRMKAIRLMKPISFLEELRIGQKLEDIPGSGFYLFKDGSLLVKKGEEPPRFYEVTEDQIAKLQYERIDRTMAFDDECEEY